MTLMTGCSLDKVYSIAKLQPVSQEQLLKLDNSNFKTTLWRLENLADQDQFVN